MNFCAFQANPHTFWWDRPLWFSALQLSTMHVPIIPFLLYFMHALNNVHTQVQSQTDPTAFCSTQCAIDYRAAYTICGFTGLEANPVNAGKHINILGLTDWNMSQYSHVYKLHAVNDSDNIIIGFNLE